MSSGTAGAGAGSGEDTLHAAEMRAGLAAEGDDFGAVEAVGAAGAGAAGAARGRPGAGALAAVEAAAAVPHGRLGAAAADPGLRPAARRRHVVAGRIAVIETAAVGRNGGDRHGGGGHRDLGHGIVASGF
jgi:hypothetical protein